MTGLDIWASLLSTGVICTLYTTVVSGPWPLRGLMGDPRQAAPPTPLSGASLCLNWAPTVFPA